VAISVMPQVKSGSCSATIEFGDDFGDNETTFHCSLLDGHDGNHIEEGDMAYDDSLSAPYQLQWADEQKRGELHFRVTVTSDTSTE